MEDKIKIDGDEITQALEDVRERYARAGRTQSEKSREAAMNEARELIRRHPDWTSKQISEETALSPKTVGQLRRQVGISAAETPERSAETKITRPAAADAKSNDNSNGNSNGIEALISIYLSVLGKSMKAGSMTLSADGGDAVITIRYRNK